MKSASAHLADGHGEVAVFDLAEPADIPLDADVVGRVGEDDAGLFFTKKCRVALRRPRVAAIEAVLADAPQIAGP